MFNPRLIWKKKRVPVQKPTVRCSKSLFICRSSVHQPRLETLPQRWSNQNPRRQILLQKATLHASDRSHQIIFNGASTADLRLQLPSPSTISNRQSNRTSRRTKPITANVDSWFTAAPATPSLNNHQDPRSNRSAISGSLASATQNHPQQPIFGSKPSAATTGISAHQSHITIGHSTLTPVTANDQKDTPIHCL